MATILIIDDNAAVHTALTTLLTLQQYRVVSAFSPQQALVELQQQAIDLVLQDMNFARGEMSGEQGQTLFYQIKQLKPQLPVILMTAWTQLHMVVQLVKDGATDYLAKPWQDQQLLSTIAQALPKAAVRDRRFADAELCGLVFASAAMQHTINMALQVAGAPVPVLITGENGAGKEGIADILHANSDRASKPLIKVNMGALPEELMAAELFGAEAGAYSGLHKTRIGRFEAADGGTLFLDEIGNLSAEGQAKLLRVLQTGEFERLGSSQTRKVSVRVVSATNADLASAIQQGRFRQDLFYRLNVVQLHVASLAERKADIVPLAEHFLAGQKQLNAPAKAALQHYSWLGNVRELQNLCQRLLLLCPHHLLSAEDLQLPQDSTASRSLDDIDRVSIEQALANAQGVVAKAARTLGISRQALYRRMEHFGIAKP